MEGLTFGSCLSRGLFLDLLVFKQVTSRSFFSLLINVILQQLQLKQALPRARAFGIQLCRQAHASADHQEVSGLLGGISASPFIYFFFFLLPSFDSCGLMRGRVDAEGLRRTSKSSVGALRTNTQ